MVATMVSRKVRSGQLMGAGGRFGPAKVGASRSQSTKGENGVDLNGHASRQAVGPHRGACMPSILAKGEDHQIRSSVQHPRVVDEVVRAANESSQPQAPHPYRRAFASDANLRQKVQRTQLRSGLRLFQRHVSVDNSEVARLTALNRRLTRNEQ